MKRINRRVKTQLLLVAMVIFLAACGQRGPLYLPKPGPEPAKTPETAANETKANETKANEINVNETNVKETNVKETKANETGDDREKTPGT